MENNKLQIQLHKQINAIYIVEIRKIAITLNLHRIYITRVSTVECRLRRFTRLVIIVLGWAVIRKIAVLSSSWYQYRRNQGTTVVPQYHKYRGTTVRYLPTNKSF